MSGDQPDNGGQKQTVADPEEFNQQRRLRSIHDARDRARATYEATQDPGVDADHQTLAANYRAAVQNYVGEIEGLLERYDFTGDDNETPDPEDDLWVGIELGPLEIPPPQELQALHSRKDVTVIGDGSLTPATYSVPGLKGYLETAAQCPLQESFELPVRRRHKGQDTVPATVTTEMPIPVSYEAYRVANRFLTSVGFDVEIESKEHRSNVTEDVVEEVEQWRKRNLEG